MLATLAVALFLLSGCRLDVVTTVEVERDGSGTLELALRMDDALLTELDELAIDPTLEVTALAGELEVWELDRTVDEEAAITITLRRPFTDPAEVGPALRGLADGLADADPALLLDLDLEVDGEGAATLNGTAVLRPPASAGVEIDGQPLGPTGERLAELTADVVHPGLQVELPGPVASHDADEVAGRTLGWQVPLDEPRTVSATSSPPGLHEQPWLWAVVAGVLVLALAAWLLVRRRRG